MRVAGQTPSCNTKSEPQPPPVGEFMASAPSVHAAPVSSGDDASRVVQDIDVEGWIFWVEWFITRGPA